MSASGSPPPNDDLIYVDDTKYGEAFVTWLARGDAVGYFVNVDGSNPRQGRSVFIPLSPQVAQMVVVGETPAAALEGGFGWNYVLREVVTDLSRFTFVCTHPSHELLFRYYSKETERTPGRYVRRYECRVCGLLVHDDTLDGSIVPVPDSQRTACKRLRSLDPKKVR